MVSSDGDLPSAVSGAAQFSELHGLDPPAGEVGTEGLTQPVSRGQRAGQREIKPRSWPLSVLRIPCGPCGRARILTSASTLFQPKNSGSSSPHHPGPLPLVQGTSLIKCSSTRRGGSGQAFASTLLHHLLKLCTCLLAK